MTSTQIAVQLDEVVAIAAAQPTNEAPGASDLRTGGAAAALLAAGAACALLGILTFVTESSASVKGLMTLSDAVGPLSGKTALPTAAWLVLWPALHLLLRAREVDLRRSAVATFALVALGVIGTFPPVYGLLAGAG